MKRFLLDLGASVIVSIVVVPCCIIGLCIGGTIWGEKVEPWLNKKLRISETEGN